VLDQGVGGAAGVGADQQRLGAGGGGQLGERQVDHVDVILGGVGAGVARPQQTGERLAGAIATVQVRQQRIEPEAALGGPGRTLLWRVCIQQRAVHINGQQPLGVRTSPPRRRSGVGAGGAQAGEPVGVTGDPFHHPPRRRGGGDRAEQLGLLTQDGKITQAVAAVGQQHRQVPQHRARVVPCRGVSPRPARHESARVSPSRSASSPSSAAPVCPAIPSPSQVTSNRIGGLVACTRKVPSSVRECDLQQAAFSLLGGPLRAQQSVTSATRTKSRG
jgi:hypothetical protein